MRLKKEVVAVNCSKKIHPGKSDKLQKKSLKGIKAEVQQVCLHLQKSGDTTLISRRHWKCSFIKTPLINFTSLSFSARY